MSKQANTVQLIKKANELVESRYRFDIWETRVMAKMITMIDKNDADFKNYRIYLKDIQEEFGLKKNKDAYKRLKEGARRLMDRTVKIVFDTPEGKKELETKVIVGVETLVQRKSFIDVTFHPNMRPFLLQLKSKFLMYDVKNILRIPSAHSIRIYELLKQYEKIGHRTFTVEELKHILSLETQYKLYGHLKSRVILKAKEDLKQHTDIYFEFEEVKQGRAIHKIKFFIYSNEVNIHDTAKKEEKKEEVAVIEKSRKEDSFLLEIMKITQTWGISKQKLQDYIDKYSKDYIQSRLQYVQRQINVREKSGKGIKSPGGYLHTIMEMADWVNPIEEKKKIELSKRRMANDLNQRKKQLKEEEKSLKTALNNKEIELTQALFANNAAAKQAAIDSAKGAKLSSYDPNKSDDQNFHDNFLFRVAVYNKAKELNAPLFKALKELYLPQIELVKKKLNNI